MSRIFRPQWWVLLLLILVDHALVPDSWADRGLGELYVFLDPLADNAPAIQIQLRQVVALHADGSEIPLRIELREIQQWRSTPQRLLAAGKLPPGAYKGLVVWVAEARIENESGQRDLMVPAEPTFVGEQFRVERRQAFVLNFELDLARSLEDEYRFEPAIHLYRPPRPAVGLLTLVSEQEEGILRVLDKSTGRVAGVIPIGRRPSGIASDPLEPRVYVAVTGEDSIVAVGLLELRILSSLQLRAGDEPLELAITPDARTLLVTDRGARALSIIDPQSMVELDRITVGDQPSSVLIDREGQRAYVTNSASASITVIDIPDRSIVGTVATEPGPFRGQLDATGESLFVIHTASPYMSVVDTQTLVVRNKVYLGPGAATLKVDIETDLLYLSREGVDIFDPSALLPVDSIAVEGRPSFLNLDAEMNHLYMLLPGRREIQVVEVVGNRFVRRIIVGSEPYWVSVSGER